MPMAVPIARSHDLSAGVSRHLYLPIPMPGPVAPTIHPAIEIPLNQAWPPGVGLGSVKETSTVLHNGSAILQAGHDCGKLIPQATIPLNNALMPAQLAVSSRKIVLKCFSVRMDGKQTGCACPWVPMLTCGDPLSMPLTLTPTNVCVGVQVGASAADVVGALVTIAGTMAIDRIFWNPSGVNLTPGREIMKSLLTMGVGLAGSAVQHRMDPRYPIHVELSVKGPSDLTFKASVSCSSSDKKNNPSQLTVGVEKRLAAHKGSGSNAKAGITETFTWDASGDETKEGLKVEAGGSAAIPAGSAAAGVSYEHRHGLPEGERDKLSAKGEVKGPVYSGTAQGAYTPGAAPAPAPAPSAAALTAIWGPPL
jgi:hypothetical protein